MSRNDFVRVARPHVAARNSGLGAAVRDTLKTGDAVAVPINGETYDRVRNRLSATASFTARQVGASTRTCKSADGLHVLVWLEPKSTPSAS
jgi:hypothetical protein